MSLTRLCAIQMVDGLRSNTHTNMKIQKKTIASQAERGEGKGIYSSDVLL